MRRVTAIAGAAAVVLWATGVFAQGKPNFAGTWSVDAEKTAAANPAPAGGGGGGGRGGGRMGGGGGPMTITQDATTFTISRETQNGPSSQTYTLDGKPHEVTTGRGSSMATAKLQGATIVIENTSEFNGTSRTTTAVYSMEGDWLVVANTSPGRQGGEPTTRKTYYKKG